MPASNSAALLDVQVLDKTMTRSELAEVLDHLQFSRQRDYACARARRSPCRSIPCRHAPSELSVPFALSATNSA
jgi:hypothetical protein